MVELLAYLRANGFKAFIVSGGAVEFMRVWAERAYGIPPSRWSAPPGARNTGSTRRASRRCCGARFAGIVHHTDAAREYAYARPSKIGQLDKALVEAKAKGWTVIDMKQDWNKVFAFEP